MSLLYRMMNSAVSTATESERHQARVRAMAAATPGDWLSIVLHHHQQIEAAFHAVNGCAQQEDRKVALLELARLMTGHSTAEESVLYPALVRCGEKKHAERAYGGQAHNKVQMAALEQLAPLSPDFVQEVARTHQAVVQHHFEEEAYWFVELVRGTTAEDHRVLGQRFQQEFDRYVCSDELVTVLESVEAQQLSPSRTQPSCS